MLSRVLRPNVDKFSEGSDDVNNGDDVRGIQFDDSEEEITCERDEKFVKVIVERPTHGNKVEFNGESLRFKVKGTKKQKKGKSPSKLNMFVPARIIGDCSKRNLNNVRIQE